jgi:hydroxypyruvate reductase
MDKKLETLRADAVKIFTAGLKSASPQMAVAKYCQRAGEIISVAGRTFDLTKISNLYVVGAGKASAAMARAVEDLVGDKVSDGIVVVKYGHTDTLKKIRQIEAGHPVPDANGLRGATEILDLVRTAGSNDLILFLISGGGSALAPLPAPGLSLEDKQATSRVLLGCGATIHEINAVRKHLSLIKGGRLAEAAYPSQIVSLIISDVVGDDLDVIASGPTVSDNSSFSDCFTIFDKYGIIDEIPQRVRNYIQAGMEGKIVESPKAAARIFEKAHNVIIASNADAVRTAKAEAEQLGYNTLLLTTMLQGETREVAHVHGAIAREILRSGNPVPRPACILSGGETTVTLRGGGLGGRNQEFALAVAILLPADQQVVFLSAGTDGSDGPTDAAGAVSDCNTASRAKAAGLDPRAYLERNDAYHLFEKLGDLLKTGPTKTNVMDLQILLIG